jgi:hypothetical protein
VVAGLQLAAFSLFEHADPQFVRKSRDDRQVDYLGDEVLHASRRRSVFAGNLSFDRLAAPV